ncbi:cytochrome P450 [Mycena polygramma]|nr:cytochrome P450 [Mycena polygramma]
MPSLIQTLPFVAIICLVRWLWHTLTARRILNNIPGPTPRSFWTGNFPDVYSVDGWGFHQHLGEKYGGVCRIDGLFGEKTLFVSDPKALHQILVKDQDIFEEPHYVTRGTRVSFGEGILSTIGAQHKKQRKLLNPVFSAAHLRKMVPVFFGVAQRVRTTLERQVQNGPKEVDVLIWCTRLALELVGQAGLGYSFDPLVDDEIPPYIQSIKKLQTTMHKMALAARFVLPWAVNIGSSRFRRFIVNTVPWQNLHDGRDIVDALYAEAVHIYNIKKEALEAGDEAVSTQIAQGQDIISILMKDNSNASSTERLSEDEIIGQLNTLVFAATDTTSSALSRTLYILAQHPDAQQKLREEIRKNRQGLEEGADFSYDQLVSLEYLDAICRETLRLYPPVSFITRTCRQDVALRTSTPITTVDGSTITEIPVPAETDIFVSILLSNRSSAIWGPDALEWKPERWLSPLPQTVVDAKVPGVYANLMTFNGGGRSCIGFKFSQLEMKVVLCALVDRFKFSPTDKDITWQMAAIAVPTVDGVKPQMPLKMELAE